VVLERRDEPGGTWTINRYPDVRVDTISITYEFSFEKDYQWNEYFGRGAEVRSYLNHISRKYGVRDHTLFNRNVKRATFDEGRNMWVLKSEAPDGPETIEANVLVTAVGTFVNPKIPQFEGRESFEGKILHPSQWSSDVDLSGKRVAVIGNGSTGVQLLTRRR
jgi:4-hydroxyacetophenone monooxygenase